MYIQYLKRFNVEKMFIKTNEYLSTYSKDNNSSQKLNFFIIKRMNACVKASRESIEFFFSHIYRVKTYKTVIFKALLIYSTRNIFLRKILTSLFRISDYYSLPNNYSSDWKDVDVLFAEWDFIGIFSENKSLVTHLVYNEKYSYKLLNEVEARKQLKNIINIPSLLDCKLDKYGWYQDQLTVSKNGQLISGKDFESAQMQMIKVINATLEKKKLKTYLEQMLQKSEKVFPIPSQVHIKIQQLVEYIKSSPNLDIETKDIFLARCHGDFNNKQLLKNNGEVFIIDWAESELNIVWHDLAYNYMFEHEETKHIKWAGLEKAVPILYRYIKSIDPEKPNDDILIAIILIEVALKQHAAFNNNRGYLNTWTKLADTFQVNRGRPVAM